ncbi:LEAF RUST 10 DISEASE-RESISTANCE LOCUS RECEPTOR-LIKE PROTEIN KINASE-like 1.1 isoform X1 [Salvia hispanica]|uniref:LEAF RUST 10 DISEASE-RESISTANCE LOCUS RECEPTOR-LIKE PROTEIN KINASE-like 1.1 isoform X1 n=1 Tax=Salvia hispanica TaxID=49212 RepID=UPI0020096F83|nr:LEAF RUST 10 DISEASE-RESISTANCE LOCUS RECEPTOR-LIKE PROTEIN KINASE-like 1.1 isoform X1 [Salvia hispanica]
MPSLLSFLFFYNLLHLPNLAASNCPKSFQCGDHFPLKIPFTDVKNPDCGLITVDGCNGSRNPVIMSEGLSGYEILGSISANQIKVFDPHLHHLYQSQLKCIPFTNLSLPKSPSISISIPLNLTFFTCSNHRNSQDYFENYLSFHDQRGGPLTAYYLDPTTDDDSAANERSIPANCGVIQLPIDSSKGDAHQLFDILTAEFFIEWNVYEACSNCFHQGGQCLHNSMNQFICEKESFKCGDQTLNFPLTRADDPDCGLIAVDGCDSDDQVIHLGGGNLGYTLLEYYDSSNKILIRDPQLEAQLLNKSCFSFMNQSLLRSPSISVSFSPNLTLFPCNVEPTDMSKFDKYFENYSKIECIYPVYYKIPSSDGTPSEQIDAPEGCWLVQLPMRSSRNSDDLFSMITANFTLEWDVCDECVGCFNGGGQCLTANNNTFYCKRENNLRKILLATLIPGSALLLVCALYIWLRKKKKVGSYLLSRNLSYDPSSKADIEDGSFNFGIPIFSYSELVEATGNFDPSKELGDGGFGTVYYGKLHDGREVAIKRLYEHNYRRVEQFLNEIKILTSLRHPNLVSLYGCTSRRSRELLLVYEYIPNGTVADHLHGQRAASAPLTWPMRMTIARETATALAYLHKSDIIHRDVKTNNILLDANFSVKVADFGLSRLFPNDVTHISTAPQGTPGYVDPEYHQCYQLTDKSDVYSFGVVLIELISSMPAVDISRHKHEINLANLAVSKIQKCAFDELIDPATGYNSDAEVTRMTTTVAELAFRCLQLDKDMRPTMEEVVAILHDIESGGDGDFEGVKGNSGGKIPPSPETDEVVLLKSRIYRSSPTAVTDTWISSASTTASSVG